MTPSPSISSSTGRLDMCASLPGYEFVVPDHVRDEIKDARPRAPDHVFLVAVDTADLRPASTRRGLRPKLDRDPQSDLAEQGLRHPCPAASAALRHSNQAVSLEDA